VTEPQYAADASAGPNVGLTIDALGRSCPVPVIMLAERIHEVAPGETIEVLSDDPAATTDLPDWCQLRGHLLVQLEKREVGWSFLVRRLH
jgi:tRNA 2-thiouridine synthesizing protein A